MVSFKFALFVRHEIKSGGDFPNLNIMGTLPLPHLPTLLHESYSYITKYLIHNIYSCSKASYFLVHQKIKIYLRVHTKTKLQQDHAQLFLS